MIFFFIEHGPFMLRLRGREPWGRDVARVSGDRENHWEEMMALVFQVMKRIMGKRCGPCFR
jgi:hypothetical protein